MKSINPIISSLISKSNSDEIAIQHGNKNYTYRNIFNDSRKLATYLSTIGMKKGDTAIIATEPGYEFLLIFYATIILKIRIAIIDPHMGNKLYQSKIKQLNPQWGFTDTRLLLLQEHPIIRYFYLKSGKNKVHIPHSNEYQTIATGPWLPLLRSYQRLGLYHIYESMEIDPTFTDYEYIITYTSGTLSEPKGVIHSLSTITTSVNHIIKLLCDTDGKSLATHLPHFMLIGISAGLKVQLWKEDWSAEKKIHFIEKNNISILFGPPSDYLNLMEYCKSVGRKLPACLQHIILGSAPVHVSFLKDLVQFIKDDTRITMMYGMTEHLVTTTVDGREKINYDCNGDLLGKPVPGVNIKIAEDGEIMIQSSQLYKRYLHLKKSNEWYATGDIGHMDENGMLILLGRKKDMIIRKNFNLYPALYEPTIKSIPGIKEAVLIGKYLDNIADEKIYLFTESEEELNKSKIMSQLAHGEYKIDRDALPDEILFTKIPRKGRQQKIDRESIRESIKYLI